jgi:hypothetical protein
MIIMIIIIIIIIITTVLGGTHVTGLRDLLILSGLGIVDTRSGA